MPVIQLPQDTRWGDLGKGLGNLLGAVAEAHQDRQAAQGVAQVAQDASIPQERKFTEILKRFGERGVKYYTEAAKAHLLMEQVGDVQAQAAERRSVGGLRDVQAQTLQAALPQAPELARARVAAEQGKAQQEQATAGLRQAETGAIPSLIGQRQASATASTATARLRNAEGDLKGEEARRLQAMPDPAQGTGEPYNPEAEFKKMVPQATPDQTQAAVNKYQSGVLEHSGGTHPDPVKGQGVGVNRMTDYAKSLTGGKEPTFASKIAQEAEQWATTAKTALETFAQSPQTGLLQGKTIAAWWEGKGGATGDAALLNLYDTGLLNAADIAKSGGGFWSAGRWQMAKDVSATIADSPLRWIINQDRVTDRKIAELESALRRPDTQHSQDLQHALESAKEIKSLTSQYQTYTTRDAHTVVIHNGSMIDPGSFAVVIPAEGQYRFKGGEHKTGAEIVQDAVTATPPVDPRRYLKALEATLGPVVR